LFFQALPGSTGHMPNRITLTEMAARLNRSPKTLKKYIKLYAVPHIRLGNALLFDPEKVEAYLENHAEFRIVTVPERKTFSRRARTKHDKEYSQFAEMLGL